MAYVKRRTVRSKKRKARKTKRIKGGMNGEKNEQTIGNKGVMNGSTTGSGSANGTNRNKEEMDRIKNDIKNVIEKLNPNERTEFVNDMTIILKPSEPAAEPPANS